MGTSESDVDYSRELREWEAANPIRVIPAIRAYFEQNPNRTWTREAALGSALQFLIEIFFGRRKRSARPQKGFSTATKDMHTCTSAPARHAGSDGSEEN
ncbi:MAG: hypothetical protein DMG13_01840 [Acidobacteria bacterium]|nr:MAG: hypothetical protein DMG13_01840 [Acidobacteriota bacterium]